MADQLTTRRALGRLLTIPSVRKGLGLTLALAFFGTALNVAIPIIVQQTVDNEILTSGGPDISGTLVQGVIAMVFMVAAGFARRYSTLRLQATAARGLSDLRVQVFGHLHRMSALHVQSERRGSLVARVTSDIYRIQEFMGWGGMGMVIGISQLTLTVIAMLVYRWQLALLVVAGVTVYATALFWFQRILGRAHDRVRERVADSMSALGESITGLPVVRAYGAEQITSRRVRTAVDRQFDAEFRTYTLGSALFSSAEIFAGSLTAGVIGVGVLLGTDNGVTTGTLLAFVFLVNLLVQPVQTLVETLDSAQAAASGMRRVIGVLDTPVDLADVDVDIPPGSRVAIVGETGSGKTTFAKLIVRLLDASEGSIRIGGIPVDEIAFDSLRSRVAYVPQEGFLFDTSVAGNVRYGRPSVDDEGIAKAFEDLGLGQWIASLPRGLDTEVGERGAQLSAGERQLVALARAWLSQPDLLVLDEATSAVDPALEVSLRRAIDRLIAGRTSITIAHRLSTAEASDFVLVFDEGRLVERGTHAELLEMDGVYAAMHADWTAGTAAV